MAITFDNASWDPSSASFSHTVGVGSNTILFVGVKSVGSGVTCTYAGVSMTQVTQRQVGAASGEYVTVFYKTAPATGSNTVAFSGASAYTAAAVSYFGASQTGIPDASGTNATDNLATVSQSITVVASGSWMGGFMRNLGSVSDADTGSIPTTRRGGTESSIAYFDSNGAVSTGSNLGAYKARGGETVGNAFGLVVWSFAPADSATTYTPQLLSLRVG